MKKLVHRLVPAGLSYHCELRLMSLYGGNTLLLEGLRTQWDWREGQESDFLHNYQYIASTEQLGGISSVGYCQQ